MFLHCSILLATNSRKLAFSSCTVLFYSWTWQDSTLTLLELNNCDIFFLACIRHKNCASSRCIKKWGFILYPDFI